MTPLNPHRNPGLGYYCPHCTDDRPETLGEWIEFPQLRSGRADSNSVVCQNSSYEGVLDSLQWLPLSQRNSLCVYLKPKREDRTRRSLPSSMATGGPLLGFWGQGDTLTDTRTLNTHRGHCYPEIFITKIFCKPKSLSCNYIQNGACFLPSSFKINSPNHAPSALLF